MDMDSPLVSPMDRLGFFLVTFLFLRGRTRCITRTKAKKLGIPVWKFGGA